MQTARVFSVSSQLVGIVSVVFLATGCFGGLQQYHEANTLGERVKGNPAHITPAKAKIVAVMAGGKPGVVMAGDFLQKFADNLQQRHPDVQVIVNNSLVMPQGMYTSQSFKPANQPKENVSEQQVAAAKAAGADIILVVSLQQAMFKNIALAGPQMMFGVPNHGLYASVTAVAIDTKEDGCFTEHDTNGHGGLVQYKITAEEMAEKFSQEHGHLFSQH